MKQIVGFSVLDQVVGGGKKQCNCCCYREPYIYGYESIYAGKANSTGDCARICMTNPAMYSGYMNCTAISYECTELSNKVIKESILYMRNKYGSHYMQEVDINTLK